MAKIRIRVEVESDDFYSGAQADAVSVSVDSDVFGAEYLGEELTELVADYVRRRDEKRGDSLTVGWTNGKPPSLKSDPHKSIWVDSGTWNAPRGPFPVGSQALANASIEAQRWAWAVPPERRKACLR